MTRKTRLFVAISGAVLAVGLGTGLVASYMGVGLQSLVIIGADGPAELDWVSSDAGFVAYANVRDVMDSEVRQRFLARRPDSRNHSDDFQAKTGINIETDVDHVVVAFSGSAPAEQDQALVVARGRFDQVRIEGLIRERGGSVADYRGSRLFAVAENDRTFGLAFVDTERVVFGSEASVRRALDVKAGSAAGLRTNDDIMNLVRDIDDGNAWAVGRLDALAGAGRLPQDVASKLPSITWLAATGRINGGVEGVIRAEANTEQAANDLREVIRGFVALARLQAGRNAELAAMLNSMQLGGDGNTVSLGFTVPLEVIDAMASRAARRPEAGHGLRPPSPDPPADVP